MIDRGRVGRFVESTVSVGVQGGATVTLARTRAVGRSETGRGAVVLVHGLGQNRFAWHLEARSMANHLAYSGWDVFNVDLREHGRSKSAVGVSSFDDHVSDLLRVSLAARELSGESAVVIGHSLGGVVAGHAAALRPDGVRALAALASPFDFGAGSATLRALRWALDRAQLSRRTESRRLPFELVWASFRHARSFWENASVPLPLRAWHPGAFEPEVLDQYLRCAFDSGSVGELVGLTKSALTGNHIANVNGTNVNGVGERFEALRLPMLVVAGEHDLLAPPRSVLPAFSRGGAVSRSFVTLPFGHGDLILGREAPALTWAVVDNWLGTLGPRGRR